MDEQELIEGVFTENPGGLTVCEIYDKLADKGVDFADHPKGSVIHFISVEARRERGALGLEDDDIALPLVLAKRLLEKMGLQPEE